MNVETTRFRIVDDDTPQVPQDPSQLPQEPSQLPQDPQEPPGEATPEPVPEKRLPFADELAGTGPASRRGLLVTAAGGLLLIAIGIGAMLVARRRR